MSFYFLRQKKKSLFLGDEHSCSYADVVTTFCSCETYQPRKIFHRSSILTHYTLMSNFLARKKKNKEENPTFNHTSHRPLQFFLNFRQVRIFRKK